MQVSELILSERQLYVVARPSVCRL